MEKIKLRVKFSLALAAALALALLAGGCSSKTESAADPAALVRTELEGRLAGLEENLQRALGFLNQSGVDGAGVLAEFRAGSEQLALISAMPEQHPELLLEQAALLKTFLPRLWKVGDDCDRILSGLSKKANLLNPASLTPAMRTDLTTTLTNLATAAWHFNKTAQNYANPVGQFLGLMKTLAPVSPAAQ